MGVVIDTFQNLKKAEQYLKRQSFNISRLAKILFFVIYFTALNLVISMATLTALCIHTHNNQVHLEQINYEYVDDEIPEYEVP